MDTALSEDFVVAQGPFIANFPAYFPVSREFVAETGSHWTASSGSESSSNQRHVCGTATAPRTYRSKQGSAAKQLIRKVVFPYQ
jgi:hypothetical protein